MRGICRSMVGLVVLAGAGTAMAGSYSFVPSPKDLNDLDHQFGYKWGIQTPWGDNEKVISASLSFDDIRNWKVEPNKLYVNLLDDAKLGVKQYRDNEASGDLFAGDGIDLVNYQNLPTTAKDMQYDFTSMQLAALGSYASDGRFGLSFDPDCHYYNNGVRLTVKTAAVPLPAGALLAMPVMGLAGMATKRLRRKGA